MTYQSQNRKKCSLLHHVVSGVKTKTANKFLFKSYTYNNILECLSASVLYKPTICRCFGLLPVNRLLDRTQIIWLSRINLLTLRYNWNFLNRMNRFREHSLRLQVSLKKKPPEQSLWFWILRISWFFYWKITWSAVCIMENFIIFLHL